MVSKGEPEVEGREPSLREQCDPLRGAWLFAGALCGWLFAALPGPWCFVVAGVLAIAALVAAMSAGSRIAVVVGVLLQQGVFLAVWQPVPDPQDRQGAYRVVVERTLGGGKGECRILSGPEPDLVGRIVRCRDGQAGDTLRGDATLRASRPATNPGGFEARRWAAGAGIEGFLSWSAPDSLAIRAGPQGLGERIRRGTTGTVARVLAARLEPASAGLWTATLLARNDALPSSALEAFRQSGLFHMLSVSGFHMAVLGGGLVVLFGLLRLPKRPAWIAAAVVVLAYAWLLRFPPPVSRSALAFLALALAMATGRRPHAGNALWLAGGVLLVLDPNAPFQMGAQLTFLATAALLWGTPALVAMLPLRWRHGRAHDWFFAPLAASLSATLATAPVLAWHVGAVPWIGIPAGLVSALSFSVGFLCALAVVCLGWLPAWASWGFAGAAEGCARIVYEVALRAGQWEPGVFVTGRPHAALVAGCLALLPVFACTVRRNLAARAWVLLVAAGAVLALFAMRPGPRALRLVFLDVGQGSATLASWPSGRHWLVDAGAVSLREDGRDAGRDAIFPAMRILGIRHMDAVVVTHADLDHYGGLGWLSHRIPPTRLLLSADTGTPPAPIFDSLARSLAARGWRFDSLRAGQILTYGDGARCEVLAPAFGHAVVRNQASLALRFRDDTAAALVAGDADSVSEAFQIASGIPLRSQVLLAGHHGSKHSSSLSWLRLVEPDHAILSYGRTNRYGHPNPEVLARLDSVGARIWRTPEGAVTVELSGAGVEVHGIDPPFWGGPWRRRVLSLP